MLQRPAENVKSKEKFQAVVFVILGLCIATVVFSSVSFEIVEVDTAVHWTMKYFALPIFIVMVPTTCFVFLRFIEADLKRCNSKVLATLRSIGGIVVLTAGFSFILIVTTLSLIILTNAYVGHSKSIHLHAVVVDYYTLRSKGRTRHYIKIQDKQIDRIVDLRVEQPFEVGELFDATMQIGHWGLLYSKE